GQPGDAGAARPARRGLDVSPSRGARVREWLRAAAGRVAALALPRDEREVILGDLEELHHGWEERHGAGRAAALYHWALMASVWARAWGRTHAWVARSGRALRRRGLDGGPVIDTKHVVRALRRQPGFAILVTLTLGAGLGSAGGVFSVVNQLLLRPLPGVSGAGGGAYLEFTSADRRKVGISGPAALEIRQSAALLDGLAVFDYVGVHLSAGDGRAAEARAYTIFGDYFELLGVRPASGRLLTADETGPGADPFRAVVSERLARELFGSPDRAVGRQVRINDGDYTVLGVAGGGFLGTTRNWEVDVWVPRPAFVPLARLPAERLWATDSGLNQDFILRPVSGASFEAVEAEIDAMLDGLVAAGTLVPRRDDPDGPTARVHPGLNVPPLMRPMVRTAVGVLSLAALLILIIPCANVANLLVVRALDARGQMAIRRALGASRGRIVGQALTESLVLALLGAAAGVGVSLAIGTTMQGETLWGLPPLEGFLVDRRVWTFGLGAR